MSYGFKVTNPNGSVVIDDEYPAVFLENETTLSGTKLFANYDTYGYDLSLTGYAPFFEIPVGKWVGYTGFTSQPFFIANLSPVNVRKTVKLTDITVTPQDYGTEVYDAAGNIIFTSSEQLIPVKGFSEDLVSNQFDAGVAAKWCSPTSASGEVFPSDVSGQNLVGVNVCFRLTDSVWENRGEIAGSTTSGSLGPFGSKNSAIFA